MFGKEDNKYLIIMNNSKETILLNRIFMTKNNVCQYCN